MADIQKNLWPGWETVKLIGKGSFGAVYEIQRDMLGEIEKAALKVISIPQNGSDIEELYADGFDEESITSTFRNHLKSIISEYSLMRKMNGCSNIVSCDDVRYVQHDDGIGWDIFIKMELLTPLIKTLPADIPEEMVIRIGAGICTALELCKKYDIIHRDIKPQNIFVSPNGDYKLGDFGIAKTVEKTTGGTKIGTYKYMAPEVYNNQPYGTTADIYSLGLVLYWLLNERRMPFLPLPPEPLRAGMDEHARMRRLSGDPIPAPLHGSDGLKAIVLKACAFDPKERYQTAAEMLNALERLSPSYFTPAVPVTAPPVQPQQGPVPPVNMWYQNTQDDKTMGLWSHPAREQAHSDNATPISNTVPDVAQNEGTIGMWGASRDIVRPAPVPPVPVQPVPVAVPQSRPQLPTLASETAPYRSASQLTSPAFVADSAPQKTQKSKGMAIFLTIFPYTGLFGVHDFYLGKKKKGILKLCTLNFLACGWLFDIILLIIGKYKKADGTYL